MKKRKAILYAFFLVLLSLLLTACGGATSGDGGEKYTVATDNSFVPFEFMDEDTGEVIGFDVDLIRAIADEAGFEVDVKPMKFDGVLAGMESGRYDIGIAGMTITEERAERMEFSDPYYDAGLMLAVQEGETDIQSEDDLEGKVVGTRSGTTSEDYLKENHPDAELKTFPGITEAYLDLAAGRLDAVMYDVPNVQYYIATKGDGKLKTAGDVLQGEQYGIAFPKDSDLVDDVNEALAAIIENGTYDDIYEEWFGERPHGTKAD